MTYRRPSIALSAGMFHRTPPKNETTLTVAAYRALLEAARSKNKMTEFYQWQRNRKIILKGELSWQQPPQLKK